MVSFSSFCYFNFDAKSSLVIWAIYAMILDLLAQKSANFGSPVFESHKFKNNRSIFGAFDEKFKNANIQFPRNPCSPASRNYRKLSLYQFDWRPGAIGIGNYFKALLHSSLFKYLSVVTTHLIPCPTSRDFVCTLFQCKEMIVIQFVHKLFSVLTNSILVSSFSCLPYYWSSLLITLYEKLSEIQSVLVVANRIQIVQFNLPFILYSPL